ncbi:hypothetical protein [Winogradskyella marincola]|uniref:Uncharacterized protein n=1 Tax=Winogradskyella marincola TaxID=3037795 RepID=A0ABT6FYH6_9FLAO|nr:hypothetical protein [Winogradskyella sp. YYF002]MDG4714838.1 hypothetical protein [Winogradskyella sp. YYF002]
MLDSYSFNKFCELLSDEDILRTSTAFGVAKQFQTYIADIKSQVLKELMNRTENQDVFLEFLINEIEKQYYVKDVGINYINKWLKEYNISIDAILEEEDHKEPIFTVLDRHYNDMEPFSKEKDKAFLVQMDFLNYFCCMYANELIEFLRFKIPKVKPQNQAQIPIAKTKPFKDEYLNVFCKEISNERAVRETSFMQLYDYGLTHYRPYLESEITENLLILDKDKKEDYLSYVLDKVTKTPYASIPENFLDQYIKKYDVDLNEFPNFKNKELNEVLNTYYQGIYHATHQEQHNLLCIQIDFYCYASMLEVKKITEFIESKSKKSNTNINLMEEELLEPISKLKWLGKPSQLGFIISSLTDLGYIEAPLRQNGDVNYTQFAKLVKQTFDIDTTENTLSKYLNTDSEKGQEPMRKFEQNGFNIPHRNIVS